MSLPLEWLHRAAEAAAEGTVVVLAVAAVAAVVAVAAAAVAVVARPAAEWAV